MKVKLFSSRRCLTVAVLLAVFLTSILAACGGEISGESEAVLPDVAELVVESASVEVGGSVDVLGSGLTPGEIVGVRMCMESGAAPVGLTGLLTPVPEVNEFGAFASSLKLKNVAVGTYTLELVEKDRVVATAPLQIKEAAGTD